MDASRTFRGSWMPTIDRPKVPAASFVIPEEDKSARLVPLATLLRHDTASSSGSDDDEAEAILSDAAADAARLRALLDEPDDDFDEAPVPEAPSLQDLLQLCDGTVSGFVCPECLMVAATQDALSEHYAAAHADLWRPTWKQLAGREGPDGYRFGDATRILARRLSSASDRAKTRIKRRLGRAFPRNEKNRTSGVVVAATLGMGVALAGAPLAGVALAAAGAAGALHHHRRRS